MAQDPCNQRGSMRSSNNATSKEACSFSSSGVVCRKQSVGGDSTGARTTICLHKQPFAPRTEQCATRSCVNSLRSTSDGRKRHSSTSLTVSPDQCAPMKPPAYYKKKEQTYLKHFFLERYLETVAFHIGYTHREFVYVDCFSGPWRSKDENLAYTSIRIALAKLNYLLEALAAQGRDIRDATDRETASITKYMDQVRNFGGYAHVTSSRILKPLHDRAYFHLIYATRSPKGVIKFRDVEKQTVREQDTVRATAQ